MMLEIVDKNVFKVMKSPNNRFLFAVLWPIIVCSVYSTWFEKYVSSTEIWFVKTATRIVKYESRVVKPNPAK